MENRAKILDEAKSEERYARVCDNCGKGMNKGHCWGDGEGYACSDECLYVYGYTPEQHKEDYENNVIYYTEWSEEDIDDEYYTEHGELIKI